MRRIAFLLVALLAATAAAAETNLVVAIRITATPAHPRNSEGAFVTLKSGRILFAYSEFTGGTSDFSPCHLAVISSDDGGRSWSAPREMFPPPAHALEMSVSFLRLKSGRLALFSAIKPGKLECLPYVRYSDDEGATWTAPRKLIAPAGYYVLNNDRVIELRDGRLVMPMGFHRAILDHELDNWEHAVDLRAIAIWFYSDDEGATWKESPTWWTIPVVSSTGLQEPGAVELADGSLYGWARTDQGAQYSFRSTDRGVTWSAPELTNLRSPASPASIKRVPDSAELLAVFNDHSGQYPFQFSPQTYAGRTPLAASLSADGGATWRPARLLASDPDLDYCYTAIHFVGDHVLFAYMANSRNPAKPSELVIQRASLPWLTAPDDALITRSKRVLHEVMNAEETWVKIHAAEALVVGGEAISIREQFLEMARHASDKVYRVGIWRVLIGTAPTPADREAGIAEVVKIFLNPASPDRSQAIETLGKVRAKVGGAMLEQARQIAADPKNKLRPLALWVLRNNGEPGALAKLCELLRSPEMSDRTGATYAFRFRRESDPMALKAIAQAALTEPKDSRVYPYLVSAAYSLRADPAHDAEWKAALDDILAHGSDDARFEACNAMLPRATAADLPRYLPLLDAKGNDSRIGGALTILYLHARE